MLIVHVSAECYPIAKVGGLADVVGALPKYLNRLEDTKSMVVMPMIESKFVHSHELEVIDSFEMPFGPHTNKVNILMNNDLSFPVYLVQIVDFGYRENVYGYDDDVYYFLAFQIAALNWIHQWENIPDIIHCHDHHTGFIPFMMQHAHMFPKFRQTPSIFTIHNGKYQGQLAYDMAAYFPWFDTWQFPLLEWDGDLNAMASAIKCAWAVSTVSPQYMQELSHGESSVAPLLRHEHNKTLGILNGIDNDEWDPSQDKFLHVNYSEKDVEEGKWANKEEICKQFGFDPSLPLISFIGRFVPQKGVDVLTDAIWHALDYLEMKVNFLIVGSGNQDMAYGINYMKNFTGNHLNTYIGYNEALARNVYAASDFIVMPSRFEPCGLNQFYALRYGAVPIVRTVGGLLDSVIDIDDYLGNGIRFIHLNIHDIIHAIQRAVGLYEDEIKLNKLRKFILLQDNSWAKSAKKYKELYEKF